MIEVPESVLAYFQQPAVRTAVDLLSGRRDPRIPDHLGWDELSTFYRACLAARQVPIEFAIFCEELWREVWGTPPDRWKSPPPNRPGRADLGVGYATVWDEGCLTRVFSSGNRSIELAVGLWDDVGIQIGILLYDLEEEVLLDEDVLTGWAQEGEWLFWTQEEITPLSAKVDLEPFRAWVVQAWRAIESGLG